MEYGEVLIWFNSFCPRSLFFVLYFARTIYSTWKRTFHWKVFHSKKVGKLQLIQIKIWHFATNWSCFDFVFSIFIFVNSSFLSAIYLWVLFGLIVLSEIISLTYTLKIYHSYKVSSAGKPIFCPFWDYSLIEY